MTGAELVLPEHPWLQFALYLVIVLVGICVITVVALVLTSRYLNGHWPWVRCATCHNRRR